MPTFSTLSILVRGGPPNPKKEEKSRHDRGTMASFSILSRVEPSQPPPPKKKRAVAPWGLYGGHASHPLLDLLVAARGAAALPGAVHQKRRAAVPQPRSGRRNGGAAGSLNPVVRD